MLSQSASRRAPPAGGNTSGRWRVNALGQLVDSASSDYLADEISKTAVGAVVALHEGSPLETASETSADSNSPIDHPVNYPAHSRGSSADTSGSGYNQNLRAGPYTPLKVGNVGEARNRPHSYSGGLSAADLTRLQQAGGSPSAGDSWTSPHGTPERQSQMDPPTYPSISAQNGYPSRSQERLPQPQAATAGSNSHDDLQSQYQQRRLSNNSMAAQNSGISSQYSSNNRSNGPSYRSGPRGYNPQAQAPVVPTPTNFAYPTPLHPSMNNSQQQLYDMMIPMTPPIDNPTMARVQQQGGFRGHQHSASDPASLRDPATIALINNSMQAFANMYPTAIPPPMFPNQFYGAPQDAYASPELAMMARLQAQYSGPYGVAMPPAASLPLASVPGTTNASPSPNPPGSTGSGPSANNRKLGLYKTELCRSWEEKGTCRYGAKCQFAHGEEELRKVQRHPKYKTEICRTFWVSGSCPYGKRCCFIHTELPGPGAPGADGTPPPANPEGRPRSGSTNSDPNEAPTSLLARLSAKRGQENALNNSNNASPPSSGTPTNTRPITLKLNTDVGDAVANAAKQNKSAYPTFAHNGIFMAPSDDAPAMSPGPVTAAPDFGRHAAARLDIVGTQRTSRTTNANPNLRHSFSGSDQLDFSSVTTPIASNQNQMSSLSPPEPSRGSRVNGHVRSGSAGNWGAATRSHLTAYPLSSIPGNDPKSNSPWADYNSTSRVEKTWV
ncbi:hypothetical protein K474DRAFT_1598415 [Panus rudis PR-1116 ss-1]|nr:hypothetical protein K474DRAFT_1598415 [Panus rudis PR-1116 ss-1]